MTTERAKFRYSVQDGVLEIEGTEEFVSKHFETLTEIVRTMAQQSGAGSNTPSNNIENERVDPTKTIPQQENSDKNSLSNYPEVYSEINGKLKIVREIPGESKKQQMTNAALLYCYGSSLQGEEQVPSKTIRETCEDHGFIDGANFAKIFDNKTMFLSDGVKGGNKTIKLTFLGKKKAEELLGNA